MNGAAWFRFFPSDWLAGTSSLSAAEIGVYVTLIALIYDSGGPIKRDDVRLSRRCGLPKAGFCRALDSLVRLEKIIDRAGELSNCRAEIELSERAILSGRHRKGAAITNNKKYAKTIVTSSLERTHSDSLDTRSANASRAGVPQPQPHISESPNGDSPPPSPKRTIRKSKPIAAPLPDNWQPSESDCAYAARQNWSRNFVNGCAEDMRLWARSKGATKVDWSATFLGWMRRAQRDGQSSFDGASSSRGSSRPPPRSNGTMEAFQNFARKHGDFPNDDEKRGPCSPDENVPMLQFLGGPGDERGQAWRLLVSAQWFGSGAHCRCLRESRSRRNRGWKIRADRRWTLSSGISQICWDIGQTVTGLAPAPGSVLGIRRDAICQRRRSKLGLLTGRTLWSWLRPSEAAKSVKSWIACRTRDWADPTFWGPYGRRRIDGPEDCKSNFWCC